MTDALLRAISVPLLLAAVMATCGLVGILSFALFRKLGRTPLCYVEITCWLLLFLWWIYHPESVAKVVIFLGGLYWMLERVCRRLRELLELRVRM